MKYFFPVVPAIFAILFGSIMVLQLLAWASLQDPRLEGASYYHAVLGKLFGPGTAWRTLLGAGCIIVGLAGILHAVILKGADVHEQKEARPVFWAALGVGAAAMFVLLIAVNWVSLQAGEMPSLAEWLKLATRER